MKRTYMASAMVLCLLPLLSLAGCGNKKIDADSVAASTEAIMEEKDLTAEAVIKWYLEKGYDNYKMNITCDSEMGMKSGKEEWVTTTKLRAESLRAGNYIYEVNKGSTKYDELEMEIADESYMEINGGMVTTYSSILHEDNWIIYDPKKLVEADIIVMDPADFKNASLEIDRNEGTYTVTLPIMDISENSYCYLQSLRFRSEEEDDGLTKGMTGEINDGKHNVVYTFAYKDLKLLSIDYDPIESSAVIESGDIKTTVTNKRYVSISFSDYGKIKEKKVKIPQKVKDKAKHWTED